MKPAPTATATATADLGIMPVGERSDGSHGPMLSGRAALRARAELMLKGLAACESCKKVGSIRDYIVVMYKGNPMTSVCPECQTGHAVLISPVEGGVNVMLVDPDRASGARIKVVQNGEIPDSVLRAIGPKTSKREL